jgi:hypothetical protein
MQGRRRSKQLIVKQQIRPLHGTAPLDAVAVNRFDHDSLAARLAEHFGNPIAVSRKRAAGWSTASGGSGRAPAAVARFQRESVTSAARRGDASRSGW